MEKIKDYIEKWKDSKVYSYQVESPNIDCSIFYCFGYSRLYL